MARRQKIEYELSAIDRTRQAFDSVDKRLGGISTKIAGLASAATVAALGVATTKALNYADGLADASEQTGFTITKLQELRFAADQSGISIGMLEGGLGRFTKRLGLARAGTGAAAKTYEQLGVDLAQTNDQVFREVVRTLGNMESETDGLALTTRLFGDDAQRLFVMFRDGEQGLAKFADQAHRLGLVLDEETARGASDANDQLAIMKQVVNVQMVRIFTELAPVITQVGQAFANAAPGIADFVSAFGDIENMTMGAAKDVAAQMEKTYSGLQKQLAERLRINKEGALLNPIDNLLTPSEEDIRAEMAQVEAKWAKAIGRVQEIVARQTERGLQNSKMQSDGAPLGMASLLGGGKDEGKNSKAVKQTLTDLEKYRQSVLHAEGATGRLYDRLEILDQLFFEGAISEGTWTRELEKLTGTMRDQAQAADEIQDVYNDFGTQIGTAFEDAIVNAESFSDVLRALEQDLMRIFLRQFITGPMEQSIGTAISGLDLGGMFAGLMNFEGGGFTGFGQRVGGMDGRGGRLAMVHPNETINDHTRPDGNHMGPRQVVVNQYVTTPDANSFRMWRGAMAQDARRAFGGA